MAIQLDDLVARLRLDTSGVGTGLSGLNSSLSSVGDKATAAGRKMTLGVTTPLVGIGIASTNLAATFDKTMRQVAIATDGPTKALSDLAKEMGAKTAFSANEAADAMLELAKGGMTAAQIEGGALAATMKLASAGGVELAEASTYVSNSMAAFGLSAKDADKVTVALAGAANASSASVQSLGLGLSQAASSARNAGLSLQETAGVLSYFDSVGLKGSDAGTSLKSMFNGLIPTTEKASKAMAAANLDFVDAEGNFVSVANMAEQLQRGLGKLGEAQRAQALETIFGSDGMRAASALMRGGAEAVEKYTKAARDQKTTTELANAAMEGTSGAMERARGSIETAGLALGEVLAPHVERAAKKVEDLANAFSSASPQTQEMIVKGLALAATIGPLAIGFGAVAKGLGAVVSVANPTTGVLGKLTTSLAEGETRMSRFASSAKTAASLGGVLALTYGLQDAAREGSDFGSVMSSAAGGAGIGAMFGPIGALVGAGAGVGLSALAGAFHKSAEEAEAARIEMLRTEGFRNAKTDADSLAKALLGVSNAYGEVARKAVRASFTGEDGKLDADIQKLRELGVSMDTIISATLGRADAQRVVDRALDVSISKEERAQASARARYDAAKEATDRAIRAMNEHTVATRDDLEAVDAAQVAQEKARKAYEATKTPLNELTALQQTFSERVRRNTGEIAAHRRQVQQLADDLGLTARQYRALPRDVRTKIEADGLPETIADSLRLIGRYGELQSFRNIKALIEATNARLTTEQIETLTKRYNLTPKQVKTLIKAVGVEAETGKVRGYKSDLDNIPPRVTTEVHTQYTYSGLKSPTRGRDDFDGRAPLTGGREPRDLGYDVGVEMVDGLTLGVMSGRGKAGEEGEKTGDEMSKGAKRAKARVEAVGRLLTQSFAEGVAGNLEHVKHAMERVMDAVEKTHNARALRIAENASKALRPLARQYEKLTEQLKIAERALADFEAARAVVEQRQAALAAAGGDLGVLDFGKDAEGNPLDVTSDRVIAALTAVRDAAADFDTNLVRLRDAGLSQDALDQLIAKGPEAAAATAQAILAGGPEAIAQINALQAQIAATGLAIQAKSSQTMYDTGVAAQQGLIAGLESQMTALEEQMTRIAKAMVRAIRKALKIKSPSKVTFGLGEFTGIGFADGLDATTRAVADAGNRLANAALVTPSSSSLTAAATAATAQAIGGPVAVRVFIGERELTDIVRVEVGDTLAPLRTLTRQGA